MTIFDMLNFLWISILAVIILTVFCTLVLHRWFTNTPNTTKEITAAINHLCKTKVQKTVKMITANIEV
jgi:uncharacterized membrane protein YvbJ